MTTRRYLIWKNGAFIDECQLRKTLIAHITAIALRSDPEADELAYYDTTTEEFTDASALVPFWNN